MTAANCRSVNVATLMLVLSGLAVSVWPEYSPNLQIQSELDDFLQGLSARYGVVYPPAAYMQPIDGAGLSAVLHAADSLDSAGTLLPRESERLGRIRRLVSGNRALVKWQRDSAAVSARVHLWGNGRVYPSYRFSDESDSLFMRGTFGAGFSGHVRQLTLYAGVDVSTDYRSKPFEPSSYQPYDGQPYNLYGRESSSNWRSTDMIRGGLVLNTPYATIDGGVDRLKAGPAVVNPLMLSGTALPLTYARARLDLKLLTYTHAAGLLRSQKDLPKYFYYHRLDVPVKRLHLNVGVSEIVTTGTTTSQVVDSLRPVYYAPQEREWEWVYLVPLIPFAFSEQYLGDRDNVGLGFDLCLLWPTSFRWYGELFLDDITAPWTIFSDDWGNKWALTVGGQYFGQIAGRDLTVNLEYTRIEPWVYTHFYGGSHNFTHFGECLGAPVGPNAAVTYLGAEWALTPRHSIGVSLTNTRTNDNRGGSIDDIFQDTIPGAGDSTHIPAYPDSWTKEFLGEGTVHSTRLGVHWSYSPFGRIQLGAAVGFDFHDAGNRLDGVLDLGFAF